LAMVAVLTAALDAGFLRSPLEARLADTSVPLSILFAWLMIAVPQVFLRPAALRPAAQRFRWAIGGLAMAVWAPAVLVVAVVISGDFYERLDKSAMTERFGKMFERIDGIAGQLRLDWDLTNWAARPQRPDLITLSLYVNACTAPGDRILVQAYMPQVLALARRAFAGGHADLRPGFFETEEAQRLTVDRLRRQSVPLILLDTGDSLRNFRKSFPIVIEHIEREYRFVGEHVFDERFGISLFVRKDRQPTRNWSPLEWPCYSDGVTHAEARASRAGRRSG
ncbi:MAG TPA: hypothetical protein VLB75_06200, partial [Steroidobacteraceae bacterium]|nr:hypothetical protein [Steroidobacteraceae bacterium]